MRLLPRSNVGPELIRQVKAISPVLIGINASVLLVLLAVVLVCLQTGLPIGYFTRDPAAITQSNPFFGLLSNIGVLFWCTSAAICLFSSTLSSTALEDEGSLFLLCSGLLSLMLLLDDLFLFHEQVFPQYFSIDQEATIAGYGAITIVYLVRFRSVITATEYVYLVLALGFFGLSQMTDYLQDPDRVVLNCPGSSAGSSRFYRHRPIAPQKGESTRYQRAASQPA